MPERDPWRRRPRSMQCTTCIWYAKDQADIGRCHRYPPATKHAYTAVAGNDWCGEHKPDETDL